MELDTAQRVTRYLERQVAWFAESIAEAECVDASDAEAITAWGMRLPARMDELDTLAREHHALLREWHAVEAEDDARARVRSLADEAETLRTALEKRYAALAAAIAARLGETDRALAALRRGQGMLEGYRPGAATPDYLDRKA